MREKGKITKTIYICLFLILTLAPKELVMAAENGTVAIENLEIGDLVEIYRIANYNGDSEKYTWASAVSNWISDTTAGKNYESLTPASMSRLTHESSKEFCEILLMGLKNDSKGVANLTGESFVLEDVDENTVSLVPGYYVILPKGKNRVYELKWFELAPGEEVDITYLDTDYYLPQITTNVENSTEDRGTQLDTGCPIAYLEDRVQVTSYISPPDYTLMYSNGKRVLNISLVIPKGFEFLENSLFIYQEADESDSESDDETDELAESKDYESISKDLYSKQQFKNAKLFISEEGQLLYFGQSGYYYEMDGSLLVGPEADDDAALEAFNLKYELEYEYENTSHEIIGSDTGPLEETTSDQDGLVDTETINEEISDQEENDSKELVSSIEGNCIFVISMDTEEEFRDIKTSYSATKNVMSTKDGWYNFITALNYSVSPLDSNRHALLLDEARAGSYGISITSCIGYADSYLKTPEELLENNARMSEDKFVLYKKSEIYDGDITQAATQITQSESSIQLVYDQSINKTTEYLQYAELNVDENGEVAIGGLEPAEYLLMQVDHVPGYDLSPESLIIEESDWITESEMDDKCLYEIIWLDYKTVYLPATGDYGRENLEAIGIIIMLFVALIFANRYRKNILIC